MKIRLLKVLAIFLIIILSILNIVLLLLFPLWFVVWFIWGYNFYKDNHDGKMENFLTIYISYLITFIVEISDGNYKD